MIDFYHDFMDLGPSLSVTSRFSCPRDVTPGPGQYDPVGGAVAKEKSGGSSGSGLQQQRKRLILPDKLEDDVFRTPSWKG